MTNKSDDYSHLLTMIEDDLSRSKKKQQVLRDLDLFVLDNSLRESTVGQLRGHTLENKWSILEEVKKCGFKNVIISSFSHVPRVDDSFVKLLSEREPDMSSYFAFSEIGEGHLKQEFPVGLKKMKKYGIQNPIFEIDLSSCKDDAKKLEILRDLMQKRIDYTYENLSTNPKILVNMRDFAPTMAKSPHIVFDFVKFLGTMPAEKRLFGIVFEEPTGDYYPEQLGAWTKSVRQLMNECDWKSAHFLVHIHKKWEFAEVAALECLASGANGVWASVCEEGAALGHACSIISIMNLVRMGNKRVLENYNCTYLRQAAIKVTEITTSKPPHPKQTVYGERALDIVFDAEGGMGASSDDFDISKFFGVEAPTRISTLASPAMVRDRLTQVFGENKEFTIDMAIEMKAVMIEDLKQGRKEEYMSAFGLAILFDRAGGKLTVEMREIIEKTEMESDAHKRLIDEVRKTWDEWDISEGVTKDDCLEFYSFYNGFMAPYFGCYECESSRKGLQAIDMDSDGKVDWSEFCVYLKWALHQYPEVATMEDLLTTAFQKGLIPAMQDEIVKANKSRK